MLDVMWRREGDKISRKCTNPNHYLHHPVAHTLSVVRTLFHQMETNITDEAGKEWKRRR